MTEPVFEDLEKILTRSSPFGNETGSLPNGEFEPSPQLRSFLKDECRILVIGAGGLGCEILKDLALSGFGDIHVMDMDTIDLSNLNRQFLFRHKDIGRHKSVTAAEFISNRCPSIKVTPYPNPNGKVTIEESEYDATSGKIQDYDADFYQNFNIIIAGLDNVEARRWINALLCSLVEVDDAGEIEDPSSIIPMIDGGTEGFKGQARLILPRITSCFECSLDSFPPQTTFAMCTIAETPRRPEHCIAYAFLMEWDKQKPFKGAKLDKDDPEHQQWVFSTAQARAQTFGIAGVTFQLTTGVMKNIIPAIASTNALISATCVHEAFKLMTFASQSLNSYMMYMGATGVHAHTFEYQRKPECLVCSTCVKTLDVEPNTTLKILRDMLLQDTSVRLTAPSIRGEGKTLLMAAGPLSKHTECGLNGTNLSKTLIELGLTCGSELTVTDNILPAMLSLHVKLHFTN